MFVIAPNFRTLFTVFSRQNCGYGVYTIPHSSFFFISHINCEYVIIQDGHNSYRISDLTATLKGNAHDEQFIVGIEEPSVVPEALSPGPGFTAELIKVSLMLLTAGITQGCPHPQTIDCYRSLLSLLSLFGKSQRWCKTLKMTGLPRLWFPWRRKVWVYLTKHESWRFLGVLLSTGPRCKLLSNHFTSLFFWSLITITSSCFLPCFPSLSLSDPHPAFFSTFWHLLDSDKQGSKYLASLLLFMLPPPPGSPCHFSTAFLLFFPPPLTDHPSLSLSKLLSLSTISHHFYFFLPKLTMAVSSIVKCSPGVLAPHQSLLWKGWWWKDEVRAHVYAHGVTGGIVNARSDGELWKTTENTSFSTGVSAHMYQASQSERVDGRSHVWAWWHAREQYGSWGWAQLPPRRSGEWGSS